MQQLRLPDAEHAVSRQPGAEEAEDIRRRRHHGRDELPQRRLQEGYAADSAAVACPGMDRVSTRGRHGWGHKNTTPPTRKTTPTVVAVAKAFTRDAPSTNVEPRCRTVACRHRRHHCHPTEAPPEGHRRVGCSRQPHSCVGRHAYQRSCGALSLSSSALMSYDRNYVWKHKIRAMNGAGCYSRWSFSVTLILRL